MKLRKRLLPVGWYPADEGAAIAAIARFAPAASDARACLAPHAGWTFSLSLAAAAIGALDRRADLVFVFGGHLGPGQKPVVYADDAVETPLGMLPVASELRDALAALRPCVEETRADNTVEIQMPIVKYFFPNASIVAFRLPADLSSEDFGAAAARLAEESGYDAVAVGSSDLTHYGYNYGFLPVGDDPERALSWMRDENDKRFLDALVNRDGPGAVAAANERGAACSPGAALGALGLAVEQKADEARIVAYGTSAEIYASDSFVGYGAVTWRRR